MVSSVLISRRTHVRTVAPPASDANRPQIGCHNVMAEGTLSASSTESGYYALNAVDGNTYDFWKPAGSTAQLTVVLSAAQDCNYMGIAAHNLFTNACTVTAQYWDGAAWQDCHTGVTPTDNKNLFIQFNNTYNSTQFRLSITGTSAPLIGVCNIGLSTEFERGFYVGHSPINLSRKSELKKNISDGGYDLGVSHLRIGAETSVTLDNITKGWVRTNLENINTDLLTKAFFFAWRPGDFANDVGYCWLNREITATNNGNPGLMRIDFNMQAHIELGTEVFPYATDCFEGELDSWSDGSRLPRYALAKTGNTLIASTWDGPSTLDVTDPSNITLLDYAGVSLRGTGVAVTSDGNTCFHNSNFSATELRSYDITDKSNITLSDTLGIGGAGVLMVLSADDSTLYVAAGAHDSLRIVDVSDPTNMVNVNTITDASIDSPYGVVLNDDETYAFLTSRNTDAVVSIDLTASPEGVVDSLERVADGASIDGPAEILYLDGYLYVCNDALDNVVIIDATDPTALAEVTTFNGDGLIDTPLGLAYNATDEVLYVSGNHGVLAFSVLDRDDPAYLQTFTVGGATEARAMHFDSTNSILYVATWDGASVRAIQLETCGCSSL